MLEWFYLGRSKKKPALGKGLKFGWLGWLLLFLLSLLMHARSRGLMLLDGATFVLCSGLIYFLFMAAWLNLFLLAGSLPLITTAAGLVALLNNLFAALGLLALSLVLAALIIHFDHRPKRS